MFYELQNTPESVLSLSDAKAFLKIDADITKDDAIITAMIESATSWGEKYTNKDFRQKDWIASFEDVCYSKFEQYGFLELKKSPVTTVDSVELSADGVYSTFTGFVRKQRSSYDRLLITGSYNLDDSVAYSFRVTFSSGYANLPNPIIDAIKEHVAFLYENRGDAASAGGLNSITVPKQIKMLYDQYRNRSGYA